MEIKQECWAKTLLNAYSYLETICGAIDKSVVNYGVSSAGSSKSTIQIANKIISLTERKKFLINIKVLVDDILRTISSANARLLVVKYIDKVKTELACEILKLSTRTYFRHVKTAVSSFAAELKKKGYDSAKLRSKMMNEGWILEIYNSYMAKNENKVEVNSDKLLKYAVNPCNSLKYFYASA